MKKNIGCGRRSKITEVYYIQNGKQYRKLLINLIRERNIAPDELQDIGIYGCNYQDMEDGCSYCETDDCFLMQHLEDKDITEHFDIYETETEFPAILVIADTHYDEKITLVSVREIKENTKYGYNGDW